MKPDAVQIYAPNVCKQVCLLISKVEHLVDLSCSPVPQPLVQTWSYHVTFYPESSPVSVVEAH